MANNHHLVHHVTCIAVRAWHCSGHPAVCSCVLTCVLKPFAWRNTRVGMLLPSILPAWRTVVLPNTTSGRRWTGNDAVTDTLPPHPTRFSMTRFQPTGYQVLRRLLPRTTTVADCDICVDGVLVNKRRATAPTNVCRSTWHWRWRSDITLTPVDTRLRFELVVMAPFVFATNC